MKIVLVLSELSQMLRRTRGVIIALCFFLNGCQMRDEHYYRYHPQVLKEQLQQCPQQTSSPLGCERLQAIAVELNELANELRQDPQMFGHRILSLQETIAAQQHQLSTGNDKTLQTSIQLNKQQLDTRLAVVRWLESPARSAWIF